MVNKKESKTKTNEKKAVKEEKPKSKVSTKPKAIKSPSAKESTKTNSKNSKSNTIVVDRNTNIAEIVFDYPAIAEVMLAYGLHCVGCFASHFDNIGEGAKIHGMDDDEVDEMITEINLVLSGKEYSDD